MNLIGLDQASEEGGDKGYTEITSLLSPYDLRVPPGTRATSLEENFGTRFLNNCKKLEERGIVVFHIVS